MKPTADAAAEEVKPRVSVTMTTYNHEPYIAQSIESALMQKTNFDFEILVGEDYSTDSTRQIVEEYAKRHSRIIRPFFNASNLGGPANFRNLLAHARGEFVNILEGDDYWTSPDKLQKQVNYLDSHPECALCFHNALRIFEGQERVSLPYNAADQKPISTLKDLWRYDFVATCTALFRNRLVRDLPEWYFNLQYGGDWALWMLCAEQGSIGYIDEVMAVYRVHKTGQWNKLGYIAKLETLIGFYETLNAKFEFRYDDTVQPLLMQRRDELRIARKAIQLVDATAADKATVAVVAAPHEELPQFGAREVWPFPVRTARETRQLFASGPVGAIEADWIGPRGQYRFELFGTGKESRLLASVTVSQQSSTEPLLSSGESKAGKEAYLTAIPNPVPKGSGLGKTLICWSTGDGSPGRVDVSLENQLVHYPPNSSAAIKELEELQHKGAEFLLVPPAAVRLFQRYPELHLHIEQNYPLANCEPEVGSIYDLRHRQTRSRSSEEAAT